MSTVGIIIIGDEILSAKVRDENSHFLASELVRLGVRVERILTIPDDIETIGREVRDYSRRFDYVITTGGVGPTHDDLTMAGVARGFDVALVRHPVLEKWIRDWYGEQLNESALKMAEVPEGSDVIMKAGLRFPPVVFKNIFILPGVPEYLRNKFAAIRDRFDGRPIFIEKLYLKPGETEVAAKLKSVAEAFGDVSIGSYPVLGQQDYKVLITIESHDSDRLASALSSLRAALGPDSLASTPKD